MLQEDLQYLEIYSSLQYDLFAETYGMSSGKRFAIALTIPFMKESTKPRKDYIVDFLKQLQIFLSRSYDYDSIKVFMSNYKRIKFILWIKKPTENCGGRSTNHRYCTLSSCYQKCYNSIVPNGSCGFQLEYIFLKRASLPIHERDNLTNESINVNSKTFLQDFTQHVARVINEPDRNTEDHIVVKSKYRKLQSWLQEIKKSSKMHGSLNLIGYPTLIGQQFFTMIVIKT